MSQEIRLAAFNRNITEVNKQINRGAQGTRYNVIKDGVNILDIVKETAGKQVRLAIKQQQPIVNANIYNILKTNGFNIATINVNGVSVKLQGEKPTLQMSNLTQRQQAFKTIQSLSAAPFSTRVKKINVESPVGNIQNLNDFIQDLPNGITAEFKFQGKNISLIKADGRIAAMNINGMGVSVFSTERTSIHLSSITQQQRQEALQNIQLLKEPPFNINIQDFYVGHPVENVDDLASFIANLPNGKRANFSYAGTVVTVNKNNGISIDIAGSSNMQSIKKLLKALDSKPVIINSLSSESIDFSKSALEKILTFKDPQLDYIEFQELKNLNFIAEGGLKAIYNLPKNLPMPRVGSLTRQLSYGKNEEIRFPSGDNDTLRNYFCIEFDGPDYISCEPSNTDCSDITRDVLMNFLRASGFFFRPADMPTDSVHENLGQVFGRLKGILKDEAAFQRLFKNDKSKDLFEGLVKKYEEGNEINFQNHVRKKSVKRDILLCFHSDKVKWPNPDISISTLDPHFKDIDNMYKYLKEIAGI